MGSLHLAKTVELLDIANMLNAKRRWHRRYGDLWDDKWPPRYLQSREGSIVTLITFPSYLYLYDRPKQEEVAGHTFEEVHRLG